MSDQKLDCCVVRDLLPSYIEALTEPDTTAQVAAHLADCADCRALEQTMRAQPPVASAPKRTLAFLKHIRRTRLLAAGLTALLMLFCLWWLYDQEFHYPNTEAGRLAAVAGYLAHDGEQRFVRGAITPETPLRVLGWSEQNGRLYVAYAADNTARVHGVMTLQRGIFGRYRPLRATRSPFPYTAGVFGETLFEQRGRHRERFFALVGDGCREIYAVTVNYTVGVPEAGQYPTIPVRYEINAPDFLLLLDYDALVGELGFAGSEVNLYADDIVLLDRDGADITAQYADDAVQTNWSGSTGSAELGMVYVLMGIAALLGLVFVRCFLRRD